MANIDLVYLWVNGNDPQWVAKRNTYLGKPIEESNVCRYVDNGDLKYSLRSIEKYAPWIHRIFIVTDNQVPEWLNTSNPKIQIVDHTEILPAESLPCFNSSVIEHFLANIPGLSEQFLYSNDDMYINQPVTPDTFFAPDGKPYAMMYRRRFGRVRQIFREKVLGKPLSPFKKIVRNASLLVKKRYGKLYAFEPHHNIDAYTRSLYLFIYNECHDELTHMWSNHTRSESDVQRSIYYFGAIANTLAHLRYVSKKHSFRLNIHLKSHFAKLEKFNPVLFCMNDCETVTDKDRIFARNYVEKMFPEKSQFEK